MLVLRTRNVHDALPQGLGILKACELRKSRNGEVAVYPEPVSTVYEFPQERVLFWPQRDANPFLHLYESLWMLQGRNDVKTLVKYAKNMLNYSNDGSKLHGAYGYRWRVFFNGNDQLTTIAARLRMNPDDRRSVLAMWHCPSDLGLSDNIKDIPCNMMATFQIGFDGELNMTVFCRSNDVIWGAYGANAVHFSILLEYMAGMIGCKIGTYTQVSVNYHAYTKVFDPLVGSGIPTKSDTWNNPYALGITPVPMFPNDDFGTELAMSRFDLELAAVMNAADNDYREYPRIVNSFLFMCQQMFIAHHHWRTLPAPERFHRALEALDDLPAFWDWVKAGKEWIGRRYDKWLQSRAD